MLYARDIAPFYSPGYHTIRVKVIRVYVLDKENLRVKFEGNLLWRLATIVLTEGW